VSTRVAVSSPEVGGARVLAARLSRRIGWALTWTLLPAVLWLVYLALPEATELRARYQASLVALVAAPVLGWTLTRRSPVASHAAAALVACLLPALTLVSLHGTDWFFSGPFGDQSFRLEYATRFAADLTGLDDYTYRDVPAFYSPGWFWVVGAVSHLTDVPAWQVYKPVAVASMFLAVPLAFWLWRRTCSVRLSAVLVAVTVIGQPSTAAGWLGGVTLLGAGASEPYGWLVTLPLPALLTWFGRSAGPFSWRRGVALGLAVALAAWLYLLYAVVAVIAVLALAVRRGSGRGRLLETLVAGATSIVLLLPWLGRFLVQWVDAGMPPSLATSWIDDDSFVELLTPAATPWALLAVLGSVALLGLSGRDHPRLRGCQALLTAVLLLSVVQLVAGQSGGGVLAHRLLIVLGGTLLAGATLALAEFAPRAARWSSGRRPERLTAAALTIALFLGLSGHATEWVSLKSDLRDLALGVPYPDGTRSPLGSAALRRQFTGTPSIDDLAAAAARVARQAGQEQPGVVLTDDIGLLAVTPLHGYQQWWELYANPLGDYDRRRAFLDDLAGTPVADVPGALRADPAAPRVFVLRADGDGYSYTSTAWDPEDARSTAWTVHFSAELFDSPDFVSTRVGDRTVAALRATVPVDGAGAGSRGGG
jgi:galactan 5-O-arabinofuranosyltransferase